MAQAHQLALPHVEFARGLSRHVARAWANGSLSDITNLTRAQDAAACFFETEERRHRGRQSLSEGRRCVVGTRMAR